MSGIKNKQHYVFQAYLKRWCGDNRLWCYKKSEHRSFSSSTDDVLNKRQMYKIQELNDDERKFIEFVMTVFRLTYADKSEMRNHIKVYLQPFTNEKVVDVLKSINSIHQNHPMYEESKKELDRLYELIREQKVNTEEDFYSSYEGEGEQWIDKLIAGDTSFYYESSNKTEAGIELINYERIDFQNFVTIQYFRTVGMRKRLAENIQNMLKTLNEHKDTPEGKKYVNFNTDNVNPEHILPHFIWVVQTKCSARLTKADIQIVRNKTKLPFITADQPVINMKAEVNKDETPTELVLWYPLSPEVGVKINGGQGEKILENKMDVDSLNYMIWNHSFEYVVGNKKELLDGMNDMEW